MALALESAPPRSTSTLAAVAGRLTVAGFASLGAGAVHAAAIGVHAEHRPAALTFTALAALQLGWGALALVRGGRLVAALGVVLGAGSIAGWAVAKVSGIPFVDGLDVAEPVQSADALAAALALGSLVLAGLSFLRLSIGAKLHLTAGLAALGVLAATVSGMASAGTHLHEGGSAADDGSAAHGHGAEVATVAHDDGAEVTTVALDDEIAPAATAEATHADAAHDVPAQAVAPVPYDPAMPIDLGGVPGVTPGQQAAAENLVAVTLLRLPQWEDSEVAEQAGFRTIGDGGTGIEHLLSREFMEDDVTLDPDRPEALVYDTSRGGRQLVAAMFMERIGLPLEEVPDIGGALMQWHTHDNLCYSPQGMVVGITNDAGECAPGLIKPVETPMIHVWIEAHPCGPFAALEGIGGGRILEGEDRLCDHAHGA